MANHLIIGLGGTGGKVLRELRKRVFEEFNSNQPTNAVFLEYLYVDSSPADLNDRTGWKVMGRSVHLQEAQKVSIHGLNAHMFQNLAMYPGVASFLNAEDIHRMTTQLGPLVTAGIGGQRRRLGRTLFANNLSIRDVNADFVSRMQQAAHRLQGLSNEAEVTFHLCAGLAGGTGSGSVVDAIAQIRKAFPPQPNGEKYKLVLYLYVPEMNVVKPNHNAGYYQANGYAALLELNAMSVGKYCPFDVTGQRDPYTGEVQRLLQGVEAFDSAYLYTNINEAGRMLDMATRLPASVADFMFQKIVASGMVGDESQMHRLEGCENDGAGPECDRAMQPVRSRRFLSFGIKRVEYPETEIKEFVTYSFARQAARQLQFNLWMEGLGFGECSIEEVGMGYADEIKDRTNRERLKLSNSYLMLNKPIVESAATRRWKDLDATWELRTQDFYDSILTTVEKQSWLAQFSNECSEYYDHNYRSHGVKRFYEIQRGERGGYASHIRRHIEKFLFDDWNSGQKSILQVEKYVRLLIADCGDRIEDFKKQIGRLEEELESIHENVRLINGEWDNIGWLRDVITGASRRVLGEYKTALCEYYATKTRIEAYHYAVELLQSILEELGILADSVVAYKHILTDILDEVTRLAESKCNPDAAEQGGQSVKKYDPEVVQRFTKRCILNEELQKANAQTIRTQLVSLLGDEEERSFLSLCERTNYETTSAVLLEICAQAAQDAMVDAGRTDPLNRMVGVNILEKLKQEYNTPEKLEQFVRDLVQSAMTYVQYNAQEQGMNINNQRAEMMKMIQLCLPNYEADLDRKLAANDPENGFRNRLIGAFRLAVPGFDPAQDVAVNYKSNQLVVVAAASGFPLRYLANVRVLKDRYEDMLAAPDADLNRMVLHTESFEQPLPSLFEMSGIDISRMMEKPLMLGYAMGLFVPKSDPTTGARFDAINLVDRYGQDNWVRVGKDFFDTLNILSEDYELARNVYQRVDENLRTQCRTNDQKVAMRKAVVAVVKEKILSSPQCENNEFSPVYAHYRALSYEIFEKELKEL